MNRIPTLTALAVAVTLIAPAPTLAQGGGDGPAFSGRTACIQRAQSLPDFAFEEARLWERQGGAADARLCQALALLLQGEWKRAAPALEASATELARDALATRANLWGRAALAWSNAKEMDKAIAAYGQALALTPTDAQLRIDRALALAGMDRFWDAITDLDQAIAASPKLTEAWLLRAQAHRALSLPTKSMDDVEEVLRLSPSHPDALLLRANLLAGRNDMVQAKRDWEAVRRVAPGTPAAVIALDNLNALDRAQTEQKREEKRKKAN